MPELTISFTEKPEEMRRLGEIFGVDGDELIKRLTALATASFEEYRIELSGVRSISTQREQRELRLCLLYLHLPEGEPTDEQIGQLFQLTRVQVANLIAGTWARFKPELESRLKRAVEAAFRAGVRFPEDEAPDTFRFRLSDSLARSLRDAIAQTNLPQIAKVQGLGQTYDLSEETALELCDRFDVKPAVLPK